MSDLVAIAYPDLATARQVTSNLGEAQKAHLIQLEDAVIVESRPAARSSCTSPPARGSARPAARCGAA